jgi:hypothetical protein
LDEKGDSDLISITLKNKIMNSLKNESSQSMNTLSECINDAVKKGYKENFKISGNKMQTEDKKSSYRAENTVISNFYRFEGNSDPQDNAVLYLIKTEDGKKGILIDAYGAYADENISNFIGEVDEIQKKSSKK